MQTENQITIRKGNKNALEVCLFIYGLNEREREPERERVEYGGNIYTILYIYVSIRVYSPFCKYFRNNPTVRITANIGIFRFDSKPAAGVVTNI